MSGMLNYFIVGSLCLVLFLLSVILSLLFPLNTQNVIYVKQLTFTTIIAILVASYTTWVQLKDIRRDLMKRKMILTQFAESFDYIEEVVQLPSIRQPFCTPLFKKAGFKKINTYIEVENDLCRLAIFDYYHAFRKTFFNQKFYTFIFIESKSVSLPYFRIEPHQKTGIKRSDKEQTLVIPQSRFNQYFDLYVHDSQTVLKWFNPDIVKFLLKDNGIFMESTPKGILVYRTFLQEDEEEIMEFILRYLHFFNLLLKGANKIY